MPSFTSNLMAKLREWKLAHKKKKSTMKIETSWEAERRKWIVEERAWVTSAQNVNLSFISKRRRGWLY